MKKLEDEVLPIAGAMMVDVSIALDTAHQLTVARWAMKSAMVLDYVAGKGPSPFYTDDERFALRLSGDVPDGTNVWLARYGHQTYSARGDTVSSGSVRPKRFTGSLTTLSYKWLVVQLLTIRRSDGYTGPINVQSNPRLWGGSLIRVLPTSRIVHWPPPMSIASGSLLAFHERMNSNRQSP